MKAFKITIPDYFDDLVAIYAAESAGKARYSARCGMLEANYNNVKFGDINVVRAPEFDVEAQKCGHTEQIGWREHLYSEKGYGVLERVEVVR